MRILYFTRDYTPHDYRFLNSLAEKDHQVYYLRLERRGTVLEDRPLPAKVENIIWAGGQKPARWQDGWNLRAGLVKVVRRLKPDKQAKTARVAREGLLVFPPGVCRTFQASGSQASYLKFR